MVRRRPRVPRLLAARRCGVRARAHAGGIGMAQPDAHQPFGLQDENDKLKSSLGDAILQEKPNVKARRGAGR